MFSLKSVQPVNFSESVLTLAEIVSLNRWISVKNSSLYTDINWRLECNGPSYNTDNSFFVCRFSPSIFLYLLCTVPTIWFLELERVDAYRDKLESNVNVDVNATSTNATDTNSTEANSTSVLRDCVKETSVSDLQVVLSDIHGVRTK